MKRFLIFTAVLLALTLITSATEISDMRDYIPDEYESKLPENVFENGTGTPFGFNYFFELVKDTFKNELGNGLGLAALLGMLLLSALFHKLAESASSGELKEAYSAVSGLCVSLYVFTSVAKLFSRCEAYLKALAGFAATVTPFVTATYAAGGNIGTAAVNETGLMFSVTVIELIVSYILYPVLNISALLTVASSVAPKLRLGSLSSFVRGLLTFLISFTVAALSAVMAFQTNLSCAADSIGARAVRFAASSFIPVVGSAVSEAVRTVSGSIGFIRTSVGFIGIAVIVIIALPIFASLMITRINLAVSAAVADMLGCERETKIIKESGALVNFLIALVSLSAVMFIYILTLLAKCSSAYGG